MTRKIYTFVTFMLVLIGLAIGNTCQAQDYFTLTNTGSSSATIYLKRQGGNYSNTVNISYSINNGSWTPMTTYGNAANTNLQVSVPAGQNIRFRGSNPRTVGYGLSTATNIYWYLYSTQSKFTASGDIMSIVAFDEATSTIIADAQISQYGFKSLFGGTNGKFTTMTDASQLKMPSNLSQYCFSNMFYGCTSLVTPPALPATALQPYCYEAMFSGCRALTSAPALPATELASYCYFSMFNGCIALTTAPHLGVTTIAEGCYQSMFKNCSTLVNIQDTLPATNLPKNCYNEMFNACTSLKYAPEIMATADCSPGQACCYNMFSDCSSLEKAPSQLLPATISSNQCYYHMFSNCPKLQEGPDIHVSTLGKTNALWYMFHNSNNVNKIRVWFKSWKNSNGTGFTDSWVYGVADQGVFYCPPELERKWQSSYNGYYTPKNVDYKWTIYSYDITFVPVEGSWADGSNDNKHFTWETDVEVIDTFINAQVDAQSQSIIKGYYLDAALKQATDLDAIRADLAVQQSTATKYIYVALKPVATQEYQISFVDEDGTTILEKDTVAAGTTPTYEGETPTKTKTAQYTYTFAGWSPALYAADKDQTYTATFTPTTRTYLVKFIDENDKPLQSGLVAYGITPECTLPTKEDDAEYTYSYAWDKPIVPVTGMATYKAVLTATKNKYLITFLDENGDTLQSSAVEYGATPVYAGATPTKESYTFAGWKPEVVSVTADAVYTAMFKEADDKITITVTSDASYGTIILLDEDENEIPASSTEGNTKQYRLEEGMFVYVKPVAVSGYYFTMWNNDPTETANPYELDVEANRTFTASFTTNFELLDSKYADDPWYAETYAPMKGRSVSVTYIRTFVKDQWTSFSLPFNYSYMKEANQTFRGAVYELDNAEYADGYLQLNFIPQTASIMANKPYILHPSKDIVNPIFENVRLLDIVDASYNVSCTSGYPVTYTNTLHKTTLEKSKNIIYLNQNKLYYSNLEKNTNMPAFRGFFNLNLPEDEIKYAPKIRIVVAGEEVMTIEDEAAEEFVRKYFDNEGNLIIERNGVQYNAQGKILNR